MAIQNKIMSEEQATVLIALMNDDTFEEMRYAAQNGNDACGLPLIQQAKNDAVAANLCYRGSGRLRPIPLAILRKAKPRKKG